jgi:hypothetical protein
MERVSIFIDSGNFYHLVLKKLGKGELEKEGKVEQIGAAGHAVTYRLK